MDVKAAVATEAGKPLSIETDELLPAREQVVSDASTSQVA